MQRSCAGEIPTLLPKVQKGNQNRCCTTEKRCYRVSQTENAEPATPITIGAAGSLHSEVQFHTKIVQRKKANMDIVFW